MYSIERTVKIIVARISILSVLILTCMGFGCGSTEQAQKVRFSGFLGDYSKLQPGGPGNPLFVYQNPRVNFKQYDRAMVERVTIWKSRESGLDKVSHRDQQRLKVLLEVRIIEALRRERVTIARQQGPGVMRIRAAITEAQKSAVAMDVVTSLVPLPSVTKLATGTRAFVGKASIEAEITDSLTGERLAAMVDRRAGNRSLEDFKNSWHDVEQAFQFWSDRFAFRLCELRRNVYCVPP